MWRGIRKRCLEMQGWRCAYCWKPLEFKQATLDHIIPRRDGGPDTYENAVAACAKCNKDRGAQPWETQWMRASTARARA